MMRPDFGNERNNMVSKYHLPSLNTELFSETNYEDVFKDQKCLDRQNRHQQQRRHVHFDEYATADEGPEQELEVSCDKNPTELFLLMNRQLWDVALTHLRSKPIEAHVWIGSHFPDSDEYKWCNLPLHLACLHGPEPTPLRFMERLIQTYPGAAQCRNHEGNLPIHLACECMDLSPRFGFEVEGIMILLIEAFPECLGMRDSRERRPIDILENKGVRAYSKERIGGRGVGIMKYMHAEARGMVEVEQRQERDEYLTNGEAKSRRRPSNIEEVHNGRDDTTLHRKEKMEEQRQERDEYLTNGEAKSRRRTSNIEEVHNGRDDTMLHKREKMESRDNSNFTALRYPRNVEVPYIIRDETTARRREKMEPRDHSKSNSAREISEQDHPNVGKSFSSTSSTNLLHTTASQCDDDGPQDDRLVIELRPSPVSSFNPIPAVTPQSNNALPLATEHFDPFHQLDAELNSMRQAHQSMSQLLSTKTQGEDELQERLRKLEMEHEQLKNKHSGTTAELKGTMAELEELTKALENRNYEVKIMKSKEKAISSELALMMRSEGENLVELKQLKNELETGKEAMNAAVEKLDHQIKISADFEETMEKSKNANAKLSSENEQLSRANKEMHAELAQQNKQLQDAKMKESTLLEMLSKMHTNDDLEETIEKGKRENEKICKENKELKKQLTQKKKQLEETKAKESEWKALTTKVKDAIGRNKLDNEQLTKECKVLQMELAQKKKELIQTKTKESKWVEQLQKENEKDGIEAEELCARNIALREVALKAIETVGVLQRRVQRMPPLSGSNKESLKQLLKDAESAHIVPAGYSRKNCILDASESLELLHPIINDAQNLQQDTIERMQQLLQQSRDIMKLSGQVSNIPHKKFAFEPTLHILEDTITTHVHVLENLGAMFEMKEKCKSKLATLLNRQPLGVISNIFTSTKNDGDDIEALDIVTIPLVREHTTKMISIAHKHVEKLECLSKTVAGLPQMKRFDLDSDKKYVRKHLKMVDKITSILHQALSNLVQDAKQMKLTNQNIHMACANEK